MLTPAAIDAYLQYVSAHAATQDHHVELEVRIGKFKADRFVSNVSRVVFKRLMATLTTNEYPLEVTYSRIESMNEYRQIVDLNTQRVTWQRKQLISNINDPEYNVRYSLNHEITLAAPPPNFVTTYSRSRKRTSFTVQPATRVDFTIITSVDIATQVAEPDLYEIEFEYIGGYGDVNDLSIFENDVTILLGLLRNTKVLYPESERYRLASSLDKVLALSTPDLNTVKAEIALIAARAAYGQPGDIPPEYIEAARLAAPRRDPTVFTNALARDQFIVKAVTMTTQVFTKPQLLLVGGKRQYVVTYKADGVRSLLVSDKNGTYLVYPPYEWNKLSDTGSAQLQVLDGEYVAADNLYIPFDMLVVDGVSIIGEPYRVRLERMLAFNLQLDNLLVAHKTFTPVTTVATFFETVNLMLDTAVLQGYDTDGLVFTDINSKYYPAEPGSIYKYKPLDKLTTDFELKWLAGDELALLVYDKDKNQLVEFTGSTFGQFTRDQVDHHNELLKERETGAIWEFAYLNDKWVPIKERPDKKGPNQLSVATDNWNALMLPLHESTIRGQDFRLAYAYHNRVKTYLYSHIPKGSVVLDIGSGYLGDAHKWAHREFNKVYAVEPNEEALMLGLERNKGIEVQILPLVAGGEDTARIKEFIGVQQVDAVSLMLSASFFWRTPALLEQLIETIVSKLKSGGTIIVLTINGETVTEMLHPRLAPDKWVREARLGVEEQVHLVLGNDRDLYITIPDSRTVVGEQHEYLVMVHQLNQRLAELGYPVVEYGPTVKYLPASRHTPPLFMPASNLQYVRLYSYMVYKGLGGQKIPYTNKMLGPDHSERPRPLAAVIKPVVKAPLAATTLPLPRLLSPVSQQRLQAEHAVHLVGMFVQDTNNDLPAPGDDAYQPLRCSWYDNLVQIAVLGGGHCFMHSVLKGAYVAYQLDNRSRVRNQMARELRRDLAVNLGNPHPDYPEYTNWEVTANGNLVTYYIRQLRDGLLEPTYANNGEMLTEGDRVDYGLWGMQWYLNSAADIDDTLFAYVAQALNIDIFVLRANRQDVFPYSYNTRLLGSTRDVVVIVGNTVHYELVGVQRPDGLLQTLFHHDDPFVTAMLSMSKEERPQLPFSPADYEAQFIQDILDIFVSRNAEGKLVFTTPPSVQRLHSNDPFVQRFEKLLPRIKARVDEMKRRN